MQGQLQPRPVHTNAEQAQLSVQQTWGLLPSSTPMVLALTVALLATVLAVSLVGIAPAVSSVWWLYGWAMYLIPIATAVALLWSTPQGRRQLFDAVSNFATNIQKASLAEAWRIFVNRIEKDAKNAISHRLVVSCLIILVSLLVFVVAAATDPVCQLVLGSIVALGALCVIAEPWRSTVYRLVFLALHFTRGLAPIWWMWVYASREEHCFSSDAENVCVAVLCTVASALSFDVVKALQLTEAQRRFILSAATLALSYIGVTRIGLSIRHAALGLALTELTSLLYSTELKAALVFWLTAESTMTFDDLIALGMRHKPRFLVALRELQRCKNATPTDTELKCVTFSRVAATAILFGFQLFAAPCPAYPLVIATALIEVLMVSKSV